MTVSYTQSVPRDYVIGDYLEYQKKWATNMRESDKQLVALIRRAVEGHSPNGHRLRLLDIGCSTGNLLLHLKRMLPGLDYTGGDVFPEIVEGCRRDPNLAGVHFEVMDIRDLGTARFDIVVANAVFHYFDDDDFARAVTSVSRVLRPGGSFLAFALFHPFEQTVFVREKSPMHPEGLNYVFRPISGVRQALEGAGFTAVDVTPFQIPIDLPRPSDPADLTTYTVTADGGERLNFRGGVYFPWCHLVARK